MRSKIIVTPIFYLLLGNDLRHTVLRCKLWYDFIGSTNPDQQASTQTCQLLPEGLQCPHQSCICSKTSCSLYPDWSMRNMAEEVRYLPSRLACEGAVSAAQGRNKRQVQCLQPCWLDEGQGGHQHASPT